MAVLEPVKLVIENYPQGTEERVDLQLDRLEDRHAARGDIVQVLAHAVLEHAELDPRVRLGDADALGEEAKSFGRVAAAAGAGEGRHARIGPAREGTRLTPRHQTPSAAGNGTQKQRSK